MAIQPSRRDVLRIGGLAAGGAVLAGATGTVAFAAVPPPTAWDEVPGILARIVPPTFPASAADESAEELWLDSNSLPLLIDRYNGTLIKGE